MKKSKLIHHTGKINVLFSMIFILLVFIYIISITLVTGLDPRLLKLTCLFLVCILGLGAVWVILLRRQITSYMDNLDRMVDGAIHGREQLTYYDETSLSSIEHKLMRYIDISKANEQNLEQEKNKIKALISDISHQTKTPLSNIMVYSQLLSEVPELNKDTLHYVNQIMMQSDKLNWLIQSLIKLSRLESGMISLRMENHPVVQMIKQTVSQVYDQAESKNILISMTCDPSIEARYDPKWTSEALFNLLENAVKYTERGGKILLTAESNEMFTRIDISDTGIGIPKEELHSVFKRFYRGQNVREFEGVGIGLFLAKEIITAQGGYIQAASEVSKGSVFSVFLPRI
ncbi:sensor histidine kinase [Paenibacillus wynnii]|uniref:sensor histidine kinase n=1 Tax=Paenibacillus wynnii TaxID=268407 RepID=UPI0027932CD7|nr:HAMP domain-containing sensor histidine kinase [Paenibacillus wynnii]MDQ0193725.1 signal transduction histidine kinase [Paenibacillus wynnii]